MKNYTGLEIAIIGMSGRFPKANTIDRYWENIKNGRDCISELTDEEMLNEGESEENLKDPLYVKSSSYLEDKEYFDSDFFGYRPDEAELLDPQARIFHECCWESLEDSGYNPFEYKGKIGLFASGSPNINWELYARLKNEEKLVDNYTVNLLSKVTFLSSRIAYKLNLKGPAIFLQTACSSSLVTVHEACNSLLLGECNMALAGGVTITNYSKRGYMYEKGLIHSKDGKCRPFDENSSGTVAGEGAGVVVLKRLKDALKDRDNIHAIIKGSAINNDGNNKVGYTAPSSKGQALVIRKALKMARVEPSTIGYIEAHGTATALGDPIEIEALNQVFGTSTNLKNLPIGAVKSNIGHLDSAAGIAGLIKTVLAIRNKQIPPLVHYNNPNPKIDFKNSPFYLSNKLKDWDSDFGVVRAGVSSFGIGGTNAHIVLEEAPDALPSEKEHDYKLILLSAESENSLEQLSEKYIAHFKNEDLNDLEDIAFTLQTGRARFKYRKVLTCQTKKQAVTKLSKNQEVIQSEATSDEDLQNIIFMFSGQGSQYTNMCKDLYSNNDFFKNQVDECLQIASKYTKTDLSAILFSVEDKHTDITKTEFAQPLLFIVEFALSKLLIYWGIKPDYMIGHSLGEYVAACISGVFSLDDAIKLILKRGELMAKADPGRMLSVNIDQETLNRILLENKQVDLAVVNTKSSLVVSGENDSINNFQNQLSKLGIESRKLKTSHAFHSFMMDGILEDFEKEVSKVLIKEPQVPYVSNITGEFVTYEEIKNPSYWSRHIRETVHFYKGTNTLLKQGNAILIELGPGKSLSNYVKQSELIKDSFKMINLVRHVKQQVNDHHYLIGKIGELWANGVIINWENFSDKEKRKKTSLPTYAFDKKSYTVNVDASQLMQSQLGGLPVIDLEKNENCIHIPHWKTAPLPKDSIKSKKGKHTFAIFSDSDQFSSELIKKLKEAGHQVMVIESGEKFKKVDDNLFLIKKTDYDPLWQYFEKNSIVIDYVLYNKGLSIERSPASYDILDEKLNNGYLGLSYLSQSLQKFQQSEKCTVVVIDNNLAEVSHADKVDPLKSTIHGPARILPIEAFNINSKVIDIPYSLDGKTPYVELVTQVIDEIFYDSKTPFIAYRYGERWVKTFQSLETSDSLKSNVKIEQGGVYIVTGGFGGMGLTIGSDIAKKYAATVVLTHRSDFPIREDWNNWLENNEKSNANSIRINQIREIENSGGNVDLYQIDITAEKEVKKFASYLTKKYSTINGIVWAAGVIDHGGIIRNRTKNDFISFIQSKIHGLLLFQKYINFSNLDFLTLFSSVANVLYHAKFGQVAYNAANEFMENYALYARKELGIHAVTINWCDWYDVGMSVKAVRKRDGLDNLDQINSKINHGIPPKKGVDIFYKVMEYDIPTLTVLQGDLLKEIKSYNTQFDKFVSDLKSKETDEEVKKYGIEDIKEESEDSLESLLIREFSKFFGNDNINSSNNFFELGGDSLSGTILIARINSAVGANLNISDLYRYPIISQISEAILNQNSNVEVKSIPKVDQKQYYPLTSAQKRMYFLQQLNPESTAYNEYQTFWIRGEIDKKKIEKIFLKLISRHEILRTSFMLVDGEPKQKISEEIDFKINYCSYDINEIDQTIASFIRPFDLSKGPLLRIGIIEKSSNEFLMILDNHHIITDLVSGSLFFNEFVSLYNNKILPELTLQYKDYAEWQQGAEQQELMQSNRNFWIDSYSELPEELCLPYDYPKKWGSVDEADVIEFSFNEKDTVALKTLASDKDASLFMVILSLYNILLSKLSNQDDIVIGTPIAGRNHHDLENVLGMFVNSLALRNTVDPNLDYKSFLERLKDMTLSCFDNQNYQYEELINDLKLDRSLNNSSLFNASISFKNVETSKFELLDFEIVPYESRKRNAKFDITLWVNEINGALYFSFEYSKALFKEDTIQRFIGAFKKIKDTVLNNIDIQLKNIDILNKEESYQLLKEYNDTESDYPSDKTVIDLFREQLEKTPDNIALVYGNKTLTYSELDVISNQFSAYLQEEFHIEPDDFVGIKLERTEWLPISILGVLKAGGAYVPIDSEYPQERIDFIKEDSGCSVCIEDRELENFRKKKLSYSKHYKAPKITSQNLAYAIYTSGSTGNPKGVMIKHSSLTNYLYWGLTYYSNNYENRLDFGLFTSLSFDLTVTSLFLPLINGNRLEVIDSEKDVLSSLKYYLESDLNCIKLTPAHINLIDGLSLKETNIKTVIVGGDVLHTTHVKILRELNPSIRIFNEYGPTESTVGCIIYEVEGAIDEILIGSPIANTQIYILDPNQKLVPKGVMGEICVGGAGLAKGYLNRPDLTNNKFVPNPFIAGERLYKTGDLGVWLSNGKVRFCGRNDNQLKIRGHRIELGEIELALIAHAGIKEAVVLAKKLSSDEKELVAYITTKDELTSMDIRLFLMTFLPNYLLPSHYVIMDELPLTSNGKIDKKALIDPKIIKEETYIAPSNKMQEQLVEIWHNVLNVEKEVIGVTRNFFDLGGNSLKVIMLIARIEKEFNTKILITYFFKNPTIKGIESMILIASLARKKESNIKKVTI